MLPATRAEGVALRLAVLISGRGSNMLSIARECAAGRVAAQIVVVIADQPDAPGLVRAAELGIANQVVDTDDFRSAQRFDKPAFEASLIKAIDASGAQLIVLAGFMRVLSPQFVACYAGRILNIHPSLLPRHKGLHTHKRALAAGDTCHGVSVHYVTAELDGGPVVLQARVPVLPGDTPATLSARVQQQEHIIYPRVIQWIASGRLVYRNSQPFFDGVPLTTPRQEST
ncbi:MAG: phosphoribosylglycinamide formyltransferase [Pseudomonadota bacterium]